MNDIIQPLKITPFNFNQFPEEEKIQLIINNHQKFNLICTYSAINELVVGFLYNCELITSIKEIKKLEIDNEHHIVSITLNSYTTTEFEDIVRTSSMAEIPENDQNSLLYHPIHRIYSLSYISSCIETLNNKTTFYHQTGGMHASLLSDGNNILSLFEDIGRHNTIDKICGNCLLNNYETNDTLLITTGRISEDMVMKAARMNVSVIGSFSTMTQKAWELATKLNLTVLGYTGKPKFSIYTCPERIKTHRI